MRKIMWYIICTSEYYVILVWNIVFYDQYLAMQARAMFETYRRGYFGGVAAFIIRS
jgi:hypothetical protein